MEVELKYRKELWRTVVEEEMVDKELGMVFRDVY